MKTPQEILELSEENERLKERVHTLFLMQDSYYRALDKIASEAIDGNNLYSIEIAMQALTKKEK